MPRPAVGAALCRCTECGGYRYGGAPACATCRALVDDILAEEWSAFLRSWQVSDRQEITELAELVAGEPDRHDWRVVDAALDQLSCPDCAGPLSRGPLGCPSCDLAHGFRYAAVETDRPGVPRGNEHAVRVNVSVVRRAHVTSPTELLARRLTLPFILTGRLPTTAQAQHLSTLLKRTPPARREQVLAQALDEALDDRSAWQ